MVVALYPVAAFDDFLASLTADTFTAEQFTVDHLRARAKAAYDEDLGIREAKITELTAASDQSAAALQEQKARNYDLLMQTGPKTTSIPSTNSPLGEPNPDDVDISAMFGPIN